VVGMNTLSTLGLSLDLLGSPVMVHLARLRSMWAHSTNFRSLIIWRCSLLISPVSHKSLAYAIVLHMAFEVLKWYPKLSFLSHHSRGSKKMMNGYVLSVHPCVVPRLMCMGGVIPK
jgi:hypothetical protein